MRALLIVLCLTAVAAAGPTSWTATEHGPPAGVPGEPVQPAKETEFFEAVAGPLVTYLNMYAVTDRDSPDQEGNGQGSCQSWYTLAFVGDDDETTDHRWRIASHLQGDGYALANSHGDGTGWGESLQVVQLTGDHKNVGSGHLAVQDNGGLSLVLSVPAGMRIWLDKTNRNEKVDSFDVDRRKATQGPGKMCRVCAETFVSARLSAQSSLGTAMSHLYGRLRGNLEMSGYCKVNGKLVKDTFKLAIDWTDPSRSNVTPPSGGIVPKPGDTPTDTPSDEERESGEELPVDPTEDAPDIPDIPDATDEPEGDDCAPLPPTTGEEPDMPPTTDGDDE